MLRTVHNQVFAMEPGALAAFADRVSAITPALISALPGSETSPAEHFDRSTDGTAQIFISGALLKSTDDAVLYRRFGIEATSYAEIRGALAEAAADPSIARVALVIDSPGGQVSGIHDAADAIATFPKPVAAHIETLGASAAYWLASQAKGGISAGRGAEVGSIGAYMAIADYSAAAAQAGIKVHVISSGPHKGAGVEGAPINDAQLAEFQAGINATADEFVNDVARGRGVDATVIKESADGRVYSSIEAQRRNLIDRIATDPAADRKNQMNDFAKAFASLLKDHAGHAALISEKMEAGSSPEAIRADIAKVEADARLAGIEAAANDAKVALEAEKAERAKSDAKVAELENALAESVAATAALKALADGAKPADQVKADPPKQINEKTADEFAEMTGVERAAFFRAGGSIKAPVDA